MQPAQQTAPGSNAADDVMLQAAEELAVRAAIAAGELVSSRFGGPLEVMQKAERDGVDIVTDVDKSSQKLIETMIEGRFPDHQVLGEEDPPDEDPPASEFMWAVDPIDGTKNFVNGVATHAVSIGLLHRGMPVVGAIWTPWPGEQGYALVHARSGHGTWLNGERIQITEGKEGGVPQPGRLAAVPGGLHGAFDVKKPLRQNMGELRTTGSTCYELMMVATGSMQYAVSGYANVWDYAAGLVVVREAGGLTLTPAVEGWRDISGWREIYGSDSDTTKRLRAWKGSVLSAAPNVAAFVSNNLQRRKRGILRRALNTVRG